MSEPTGALRRLSHVRRSWSLFVVFALVASQLGLLSSPGPSAAAGPPPTTTARGSSGDRFVPSTRIEGETAILPMTLLDGRRMELRYPRRLELARLGLRVGTSVDWPVRRDPLRCCGRVIGAQFTTIAKVYRGAKPIRVYSGARGRRVPYYRASDAGQTVALNYLVFQFGPWMVEVYDVQRPGAFEDRMTDTERARWARNFDGHVGRDGFLVLKARKPLQLQHDFTLVLGVGAAGTTQVEISSYACGMPASDTAERRRFVQPSGSVGVAWCDPATGAHVTVEGPPDVVDVAALGLKLRTL